MSLAGDAATRRYRRRDDFLRPSDGRLRGTAPTLRATLNAGAVGVLLFLLWDVLAAAWEPIDAALVDLHTEDHGLGLAAGYGLLFAAGISVGLLSLVAYERRMSRSGVDRGRFGPGAMAAAELSARRAGLAVWSPAKRLALLIAVGIGLHNFA